MIYVSNTKELAEHAMMDTVYGKFLTAIDDFQGCETPVAVVFFSKAPDGDYSQLLEMCSRAQYKLILVMFDNQTLHDMIARSETDISVKDILVLHCQPALLVATETNNVALVQQLLNCGATWKDLDEDGNTPLLFATKEGHAALVKKLLVNGADAKYQDKNGLTPLHVAANLGFNDTCVVLIDHGADLEKEDQEGNTPLMIAAANGHLSTKALLLQKGAVHKVTLSETRDSYSHKSQINCIGWQPGKEVLASGSGDGSLKIWKVVRLDGVEEMSN